MMKIKSLALGLLAVAMLTSCASRRDTLSYFQDIETESFNVPIDVNAIQPKIEPMDELAITVSSLQPGLTASYNLPLTNPVSAAQGYISGSTPSLSTYVVSPDGNIVMPMLGTVHVAGLTVDQLAENLTQKISKEVQEPIVVVKLINFKINIGGEVAHPGQYMVRGTRFSILDALSTAGDITPYGKRENVLLIREVDGKKVAYTLDLTSSDVLTSPYFYLKQNDYVYVAPNKIRNSNAKYNQNNAFKISVVSTIVSGVSVIASLVIALAIK